MTHDNEQPRRDQPRVAVLLLSYNRPKMLDLAFASIAPIRPSDSIILIDDGSDTFNAGDWASEHGVYIVQGRRRSLDERMTKPSLGRLINRALSEITRQDWADVVGYLCDDDLFTPEWIPSLRQAAADHPDQHVFRGRWRSFRDPCVPEPLAKPGRSHASPLDWRQMTTGNFAHRIECYAHEGVSWDESKIAVHDDYFLWRLHAVHPLNKALAIPVTAGYRREHPYNMAHYTQHGEYGIGAENVLARGNLE